MLTTNHSETTRAPSSPIPNVLLVDDRPANLMALEAILEPLHVALVRATSGTDALRQLLLAEFAVVILDVNMPGLDGFETARRIRDRERTRDLPIVFVTAEDATDESRSKGYALGAVDYLTKPFDSATLRAKVATFAELWRRREALRLAEQQSHDEAEARLRYEVRRREQQLRSIVDGVHDHAISMLDPDGRVITINAPAERIKGYALAEAAGKFFGMFFTEEDRAKGLPEEELAVARAEGIYRGEGLRRRKDGSTFYAQVTLSALRDESGEVTGFVKVTYDITERRRLQAETERLLEIAREERARAEDANRTKDLFLSTLSHELRTPLNAILGWTQMLKSGSLSDDKRERALDTIDRNAHNQVALIEDILDISRITTGNMRLQPVPLALPAMIESVLDTVRPAADAKGVQLQAEIEGEIPTLEADPTRMQQVAWNLMSNAVKFTPRGGHVMVRLEHDVGEVRLIVRDSGQGIDAEFLPHVFEAFRQQDSTTTRKHGGLGLGLAIVKRLVELHGGVIRAASEGPGRGATFTVSLPIGSLPREAVQRRERRATGEAEYQKSLDGARILVCDDEEDARLLLQAVFEARNAHVEIVASAASALSAIETQPFDVLVSDIGMPDEDGYSLIGKIRARPAEQGGDIVAIALTAYASDLDRRRALRAGFDAHATKPVEPEKINRMIAELLAR